MKRRFVIINMLISIHSTEKVTFKQRARDERISLEEI